MDKPAPFPLFAPFAALRPVPSSAGAIAAPPYDVMTADEARAMARGKPWSFLHVSRPEIDLPPDTDPHADAVYAKGAANLARMLTAGVLIRETTPAYYVYRMERDGHGQTGIAAAASLAAYEANRVRRHELTRPDKETDRVRHMEALDAQTGPVFVVHRADPAVARIMDQAIAAVPVADVTLTDGVRHRIWRVAGADDIAALTKAFEAMDAIYIADGHHRSAAAARVARSRGPVGPHQRFLVVSFPDDQVVIRDYNRVVRDLAGRKPDAFLAALGQRLSVTAAEQPVRPERSGIFGLYLAGRWYRLALAEGVAGGLGAVARLDVSLLASQVLEPLLGIVDPRTDKRIDFVGGSRGLDGVRARVDSGEMAAGFTLFPTALADLMAVADAGDVMPPKSTWFEPKLADGLLINPLGRLAADAISST